MTRPLVVLEFVGMCDVQASREDKKRMCVIIAVQLDAQGRKMLN